MTVPISRYHDTIECYDPETDSWEIVGEMQSSRSWLSCVSLVLHKDVLNRDRHTHHCTVWHAHSKRRADDCTMLHAYSKTRRRLYNVARLILWTHRTVWHAQCQTWPPLDSPTLYSVISCTIFYSSVLWESIFINSPSQNSSFLIVYVVLLYEHMTWTFHNLRNFLSNSSCKSFDIHVVARW